MKSALIIKTYLWFYNIIRNYGPLTLNQINEMWMADTRISEGKPMIRQTFQRYRLDVEDVFGVSIGCDNENRYLITKTDGNGKITYVNRLTQPDPQNPEQTLMDSLLKTIDAYAVEK